MLLLNSARRLSWLSRTLVLSLLVLLLIPAYAAAVASAPTLIFPWQQVWPIVIGAIVPLATYVLNHVGPWLSEPIKAAVLVVVSALATALYTALATSVIGFNDATLQLILTGIAAALAAHHLLWKPSGLAGLLGAGSNRQRVAAAGSPPAPVAAPGAGTGPPAA